MLNNTYWTSILKRVFYVILIAVLVFCSLKLAVFYMPFLIAFIIYLTIEPAIKKLMKVFKLSRKISSIIVFVLVFGTILGLLVWGIVTIVSEANDLLSGFNGYYEKIYNQFQTIINNLNFEKFNISDKITQIFQDTGISILQKLSVYLQGFLSKLIKFVTSIPTIAIYFAVTILALYFICTDKIYMIDELELLIALGIGFVDALPILGSGTVMIPWAIISGLNGDLPLGISIIVLLIIMSISRQFVEPKIVSGNIGIHPIFTIIAMYTGFKLIGVLGMFVGPILLIIFKNIFSDFIDDGVLKVIFEK